MLITHTSLKENNENIAKWVRLWVATTQDTFVSRYNIIVFYSIIVPFGFCINFGKITNRNHIQTHSTKCNVDGIAKDLGGIKQPDINQIWILNIDVGSVRVWGVGKSPSGDFNVGIVVC